MTISWASRPTINHLKLSLLGWKAVSINIEERESGRGEGEIFPLYESVLKQWEISKFNFSFW